MGEPSISMRVSVDVYRLVEKTKLEKGLTLMDALNLILADAEDAEKYKKENAELKKENEELKKENDDYEEKIAKWQKKLTKK